MSGETLARIHQQLLTLDSDRLEIVLKFVSDLNIPRQKQNEDSEKSSNSSFLTTENERSSMQEQEYDITTTKTWLAIGKYQIPNPEPQYIVSDENRQKLMTNYAEYIDAILYPSADSI